MRSGLILIALSALATLPVAAGAVVSCPDRTPAAVTKVSAASGEVLTAGTPVVSIGLVRRLWVRAYVGERFVGRLKVGQEARVRMDGAPDTAFAGRVTEISPRAEFTPRAALTERERADLVFGIKVAIDDAGGRLKAGMPVQVDLPLLP